ncbi:LOW QUALITY PROTEIN: neprilysin-2-like [Metopolophium dirhodum]|uniref:LOW QUALITY PROTEIN: neprilysin-2-like n=1 Tax=Metopolophium dirhodum TaxID=44670 RepID=UPI00298FCBDC|nr:LOW QUALITY PROTEIN: neprilysin-2-like [Metopolophium dirhodum]
MSVADSEYDGVAHVTTDNHYLRDYHRSAEKQQQQTVGVVAGNAGPPIAAGPEVHQAHQPMAPPALQQSQLQQQPNGGDVGFVSVSSRKHRKLQDVFRSRSFQEKCIIAFVAVLGCAGLVLTVMKIRGGVMKRTCRSDECLTSAESIMRSINVDVEPCDNFYEFACGKWQFSHHQESGKPNNWFVERSRFISAKVTKILEEPDRESDLESIKQARHLYRTCLDTDTLNNLGYEPVFEFLEKVGLPRRFPDFTTTSYLNGSTFNVARSLALIERYFGVDLMLQLSLELNPKTNRTIITVGPVTNIVSPLPEPLFDHRRNRVGDQRPRDVSSFDREAETSRLVIAKVQYMVGVITSMFPDEYFNISSLNHICLKIIVLEVTLKKNLDLEKKPKEFTTRDLSDYMHSNTSDSFDEKLFDWQSFIDHFTLESNFTWTMDDTVLVRDQDYFLELQWRLTDTPLEEIQQFLWWRIVESLIPHTTVQMADMKSKFNTIAVPLSLKINRKQFCTSVARSFVKGPIAYEFYVRDNLKGTTSKIQMMIRQLQGAFSDMISESDWADEATKKVATLKANAMRIGVGYPTIFESPDELEKNYNYIIVKDDQYLQSMLDIKSYEVAFVLGKVGEEITMQDESGPKTVVTDPLEVNAYYNRMDNSINIPSGILQMPFFYKGVDVVNYGAIGTILGHEISHGFDIEGKDYDIHGKKTSQWSHNAVQEYLKRAQCFVEQYDQFVLDSDNNLNGTHTLAENMADNVGLKQSWKAYKSHNVGEEFRLAGLKEYSNDQLFFLSYANVWCQNPEDEKSEKIDIFGNDEHSPSFARVLGSLRNSPEFADVWKCPVGSPMNPSKKCSMW